MCDGVGRWRGFAGAALAAALVLAAGCGSPTATVSGKVTYRGEPLPGATVAFMTADTKWVARATTGPDGSYALSRVPLGEVDVTLEAPRPQGAPGVPGGGPPGKMTPPKGADLPPGWEKSPIYNPAASGAKAVPLPTKYADPGKSGLGCTVHAGQNTYDITLR